jgi:hypothetical protein
MTKKVLSAVLIGRLRFPNHLNEEAFESAIIGPLRLS